MAHLTIRFFHSLYGIHALAALVFCILAAGSAHAQPIGRMFTTPQERQQLDIARGLLAPPPQPAVQIAAPPPEPLTVNGFVRRSGGKSTVWLNQQAQEGKRVTTKNGVVITLPSGRNVIVKPGQSIDMNDGRIIEAPRQ